MSALPDGAGVFTLANHDAINTLLGVAAGAPTGTGALVLNTSPTLVTPALGTPASGVLTNCTGLVPATGLSAVTGTGSAVLANTPTLVTPILGVAAATTLNYISAETGANNAIVGTLANAPALTAGLRVSVLLAHSLQAGGNTFAYGGGAALAIKSHRNPANNIGVAYVSTGIVDLMYDGTQWQDMSQ